MTKFLKGNLLKIALIFAMLAFAAVCMVSGTLAALSAEYTWTSDTATVGAFDFSDTDYTLELFGADDVYPGDNGSGVLSAPDFGTNTVSWAFAETNSDNIPIVYYVLSSGAPADMYSKYDFATAYSGCYLKLSDSYVSVSDVSSSSVDLAAALDDGVQIYWSWPDKIYSDNSGAVASGTAVDTYAANNATLCTTLGTFPSELCGSDYVGSNATGSGLPFYYASDFSGGNYTVVSAEGAYTMSSNKLKYDSNFVPLYSGSEFFVPAGDYSVKGTDCYVFIIKSSKSAEYKTKLEGIGCTVSVSTQTYGISGTATTDGTAYVAVQVFPESAARASVSVTITATIVQA